MGKVTLQMRQPKKSVAGTSASRPAKAGTKATPKVKPVKPTKPINLYPSLSDMIATMEPETESERVRRELQEYVRGGRAPTPVAGSSISDSELVSKIKKVVKTVSEGATVGCDRGRVHISISGATAELLSQPGGKLGVKVTPTGNAEVYAEQKTPGGKVRLATGLDEPVHFEVVHQDIRFEGKVNQQRWEMTLSIGQTVPNIADLPKIFQQGESSLRSVAIAAKDFDVNNIDATGKAVEPHVEPLGKAIKAAEKLYRAEPRWSFGISATGPMSDQSEMPTTIGAVLTFHF